MSTVALFEGYGGFEDLATLESPNAKALSARGRMTQEQRTTRFALPLLPS